tara:strand:- start:341 stop:793 length:453 start_codon:yes stop_codon:yes gene_type:complete
MVEVEVKIKRMYDYAILPRYEHKGEDAAMDFFASEDVLFKPGERGLVHTGIKLELPKGYELQMRPRSGLALKAGVTLLNSPGTVDPGYRGEVGAIIINHGQEDFYVKRGDKIAQGALKEIVFGNLIEVDELSDSARGEGGFGSSGGHSSL